MRMGILMRLKFKLISTFLCVAVVALPTVSAFNAQEVIKIQEIRNFLKKNQEPRSEEFKGTSELDTLNRMIKFFIDKMPWDCENIADIKIMYDIILEFKSRLEELEFIEDNLYKELQKQEEMYAVYLDNFRISQINEFLDYDKKPTFPEISGDSEMEILYNIYCFLNNIKFRHIAKHCNIENMRNIIYKMNVRLKRVGNCNFDLKEFEKWLSRKEEELKLSEIEEFFLNKNFSFLSEFKASFEKESIYKMYLFLINTELKNCHDKEYIRYLYEVSLKMKNYLAETNRLDDFLNFNLKALELLYYSHINDFCVNENLKKSIHFWKEASKMYCSIKEILINHPYETIEYMASFEDISCMEKYCLKNALFREGVLHYSLKENLKALQLFCESYCLLRNKERFNERDKKWKCIPKCVEKVSLDVRELGLSNQNDEAFRMIIELVKQLIIIDYDPAFINSCKTVIYMNIIEIFNKGEQLMIKNLHKEARKAYFVALEGAIFMNDDYYKFMCKQRINACMERLKDTTDSEILELND